ncbi:MAG TPA: HigA family addiction module antitoxin [Candidatus Binatia bacterium]|jgi:HTH-type transcriptional regulator/antitoxin HigA
MATRGKEPVAARLKPGIAIPPGETLVEELEARGMSQSELARRAGRPVQAINEIARGKKEITAETALAFERVLGVSAEFWLRLDAQYRLARARVRTAKAPAKIVATSRKKPSRSARR